MSADFEPASAPWTLSVTLLKEVTVTLHTADGRSYRVPISPNARRVQLLAYLAWRRDQYVSRERPPTELFGPDLCKEKDMSRKEFRHLLRRGSEEESRQLSREVWERFAVHKKLLWGDIRAAVVQLNAERAGDPLPTNLAPFEGRRLNWRLSSLWQAIDLETIEALARDIQAGLEPDELADLDEDLDLDEDPETVVPHTRYVWVASESGESICIELIPDSVKAACDALLAAYPGDFLEEMLRAYPEEFEPLKTSWVREPSTLYRDYYLSALWNAGEYEWQKGRAQVDGPPREHFERAAEYFQRHAMYVCNSGLDTRVSFSEDHYAKGPHVFVSELAICRSLSFYQAQGRMQEFEACKQAYTQQMEQISGGTWKPGDELQKILQAAMG